MRILYATELSPNSSSLYRTWALERLGHSVIPLNTLNYLSSNAILRKVLHRLSAGPGVDRLNRDLLRLAETEKPDILWADKVLWMKPSTLARLREMGIGTVSYMIDNPFGPRQDPGWRLYMKDIPLYDLHVVQRDKNILDYRQRGARNVIKIQTAYEPTIHFPPSSKWSDANRNREVSFIGTPYDDRAETLAKLYKLKKFQVAVSGSPPLWLRALGPTVYQAIFRDGELYRQAYREAIWSSKINLSFLTHSNQDEFVHKSFEIAGCGGFLLAERSAGHLQRFVEDEEAVFFADFADMEQKILRYLPDEAARSRIAAAGCARAARDGYHNDRQVSLIVERVEQLLPKVKAAAGAAQ